MWRLSVSLVGAATPISSNFERVDTDGFGKLGTGMAVSSGIWTFPTTGVWRIDFKAQLFGTAGADTNVGIKLETTLDNSAYDVAASGDTSHANDAQEIALSHFIFDVTDVTTHKVRFATTGATSNTRYGGSTDQNATQFTFTKVGDT